MTIDEIGIREIVPGDVGGGANTSHTIVVPALGLVLEAVPADAQHLAYREAVLDHNVLGKATEASRRRTLRYLRELYLLRPDSVLFRALRDLWAMDADALPVLAGLCALARDSSFRASSAAVLDATPGSTLVSADLAEAVRLKLPNAYSDSSRAKVGRNAFSSWEQTGHLVPAVRPAKTRTRVVARPASVTYALLLGYLQGARGQALFTTLWAQVLDAPTSELVDLASAAAQQGMLKFRRAGGVVDVGFGDLLRPLQVVCQGALL